MNMVTLTNASLSQSFPFQTNTKLDTDASFCSYLSNTEEAFVRSLSGSSRKLNPINIISTTTQEDHNNLGRKKELQDEEIGVFGAEKYFNGVIERESPRIASNKSARKTKHERVNLDQMNTKNQSGTPSIRSESSWNSQSGLLQSGMRNPYRKKNNNNKMNTNGKNFFSNLGCNYCSCSDKNAVDVNEDVGEISFKKSNNNNGKSSTNSPIKTTSSLNHVGDRAVQIDQDREMMIMNNSKRLDREPCFSFSSSKHGVEIQFQEDDNHQDKQRKSLEVFGSPVMEKGNPRSLSLERRLTMLSNWDITTTPRAAEEIEFNANSAGIYHDSESDASSDLFEIDSLTGKTNNNNPFLARLPSDIDTSGCVTPTTCYAPSEASIEWSVVTASAADVSVMSDCEDQQRSAIHVSSPMKTSTAINKEIQRRRPSNILLGCKSHKAVRVAGDAYRSTNDHHNKTFYHHVDPHIRRRSDSSISMTRFQAGNNLTDFSPGLGQHALPTHSLPRLHSPRNSHLLYIQ